MGRHVCIFWKDERTIVPKTATRPHAIPLNLAWASCLGPRGSVSRGLKISSGWTTMITPARAAMAPVRSTKVKFPWSMYLERIMAPNGARKFKAVA